MTKDKYGWAGTCLQIMATNWGERRRYTVTGDYDRIENGRIVLIGENGKEYRVPMTQITNITSVTKKGRDAEDERWRA